MPGHTQPNTSTAKGTGPRTIHANLYAQAYATRPTGHHKKLQHAQQTQPACRNIHNPTHRQQKGVKPHTIQQHLHVRTYATQHIKRHQPHQYAQQPHHACPDIRNPTHQQAAQISRTPSTPTCMSGHTAAVRLSRVSRIVRGFTHTMPSRAVRNGVPGDATGTDCEITRTVTHPIR